MTSSVISNFVTIKKTKNDILKPAEYESIVNAIQGMMIDYNAFKSAAADLNLHVVNYNDPHESAKYLFNDVILHVYNIYTQMTSSPLSLFDFQNQIVPSIGFLELTRRILLNRYLYNQIKNIDGSVPVNSSPILTGDWGYSDVPQESVDKVFNSGITNEAEFIAVGLSDFFTSTNDVFNANDLTDVIGTEVALFATSSAEPYCSPYDNGSGYSKSIFSSTKSVSLALQLIHLPLVPTVVLSLSNTIGTISIQMNPDATLSVLVNSTVISTSNISCYNGGVMLSVGNSGSLELKTSTDGFSSNNNAALASILSNAITTITLGIKTEDLSVSKPTFLISSGGSVLVTPSGQTIDLAYDAYFAIRSLVVYDGYIEIFPSGSGLGASVGAGLLAGLITTDSGAYITT